MEDKRYTFIDKTMAAFSLGMISDLMTLLLVMERAGISQEELAIFRDLKMSAMVSNKPMGVLCPECKTPMAFGRVNTAPGNQTGDDSKIVYTCMNQNCMNQMFE